MKTQINSLRSGSRNQRFNPEVDYSEHYRNASTSNPVGNYRKAGGKDIWEKVRKENPEYMVVEILGETLELKASHSLSGKSTIYYGFIPRDIAREKFNLTLAKHEDPEISIQGSDTIIISNGKRDNYRLCPSFVTIK